MKAMKTVEEMRVAVLAECDTVCPNRDFPAKADWGHLMFGYVKYDGDDYEAWFLYVSASIHPISLYARSADQIWIAAYSLLGLSERDAVAELREESDKYFTELKAERARNAALVAALDGIKAEFKRLKDGAKTLYDTVYLEGVLAVIEAKSGEALAANEKGGINA